MRLNVDWQWPTGSVVYLQTYDLHAMKAAGVDTDDADAIEMYVRNQLKHPQLRSEWIRRIVDDWTDRSEGDFDIIELVVEER